METSMEINEMPKVAPAIKLDGKAKRRMKRKMGRVRIKNVKLGAKNPNLV